MEKEDFPDFATTNCFMRTPSTNQKKFTLKWNIETCSQYLSISDYLQVCFAFFIDDGFCRFKKSDTGMIFEIILEFEFFCKISFSNNENYVLNKGSGRSSIIEEQPHRFHFCHSVDFNALISLPNDELIIICSVEGKKLGTVTYNQDPYEYLKFLSDNIQDKFAHRSVILRVGKDTESISQAVLLVNSTYFTKLLAKEPKRNCENIIDIEGIDFSVVKHMVNFLNSGILRCDDFEMVCSLYRTALKYQIDKLLDACSELLVFKLDIKTVIRILVLSNMSVCNVELKKKALMFFKDHAENVLATEEWCDLMRDETNRSLGFEAIGIYVQSVELEWKKQLNIT